MSRFLQRLHRIGRRAVTASGVPGLRDRAVVRSAFRGHPREPCTQLLLAAPGKGNAGDQALLEAVLENLDAPVTLIVSDAAGVDLPVAVRPRVEVLALPDLVYGTGAAHRVALARFGRALAAASHLSIVGADVMDGRYSLPASVRRADLAAVAARLGVDTRIIGFSWSDRPRAAARRALAAAARSGVRLLLRDPVSAERARRDGIAPVHDAADVVFAASTVATSAAEVLLGDVAGPVALVNVSGLLAARGDQTADYVEIVAALRSRGLHVLLVPHVAREGNDDVAACAAVARRAGPAGVSTVPALLTPAEVRGLTARAALTVTGRMHLAVMSLMHGVPAVTLATQGKVEGLMRLFGVPELCVEPRPGFSADVVGVLDRVLPGDSATRSAVRRALPGVVALAWRNLEGLPGAAVPEPGR